MSDHAEGKRPEDGGASLASAWPWLVFPMLPLLAALSLLHVIYAPEFTFATAGGTCLDASPGGFASAFIDGAQRSFIHFESFLVYASANLFHVALCLFAGLYLLGEIRALPAPQARRAWRLVGLLLLLLVVIGIGARLDATALQLSYRNTCELLCKAQVAPHIVPRDCRGGAASPLLWFAAVPTLVGLIAATLAAALASSAAAPLPQTDEVRWRAAFAERVRHLQRVFYVTSAVLVTSTVTIMLFLELPVALAADEPTTLALTSYVRGMTVFWGTTFTLTLLAIFAPSVYQLLRAAQRHERTSEQPAELRTWLKEQVAVSIPKQLGNLVAFLAPLLVGPIGTLLEKLAAAG